MATTRRRLLGTLAGGGLLLGGGCLGNGGSTATPTEVGADALPAPHLGAAESSVVVRVWEDFGCPHCREYNDRVVPELRDPYLAEGRVRYEHHDFPIPVTEWSWPTAIAARSVQATVDTDAFWTFAEGAYANQSAMEWSTVRDLAEEAGAAPDTVVEQARGERWRPVVAADRSDGRDRGVEGTPTVFVNDAKIPPGNSWTEFSQNIADAIEERL